ncbi:type II secretion system protein [Kribbella sp.]|uniref:type II secretion system protein n=1 Tax=Kribbella sp. TaxID=1871183 RepID=UPI002D7258A0|nr:prepilin-type N-terminal cleavage/methylation domain-containing protein [Kribbella sp.]HZX04962.1 prepilin-type N-terminal cleavage/methylation domain-containing protein [Kribbella sp.]
MLNRLHEARRNQSGFTLIELLMVIVILGVLSGIVVFAVQGIQDRGYASACKSDVKSVEVAVEAYYAKNGTYPTLQTDLTAGTSQFLRSWPNSTKYAVTLGANGAVTAAPSCDTL